MNDISVEKCARSARKYVDVRAAHDLDPQAAKKEQRMGSSDMVEASSHLQASFEMGKRERLQSGALLSILLQVRPKSRPNAKGQRPEWITLVKRPSVPFRPNVFLCRYFPLSNLFRPRTHLFPQPDPGETVHGATSDSHCRFPCKNETKSPIRSKPEAASDISEFLAWLQLAPHIRPVSLSEGE